jgi:hypothetical protein
MAYEETLAVPSRRSREKRTSQDKVKDFCSCVNVTYIWHFKHTHTHTHKRMHLHCNNACDVLPSKRVTVFCEDRSNGNQTAV